MAIGKRIKFFRTLKGYTQKQFGELLGFKGRTADVRIAQYEAEARIPKDDLIEHMAHLLDVSTVALSVPDIDTYYGIMHTLFALEDMHGFKINKIDGNTCITLDTSHSSYRSLSDMFFAWQSEYEKYKAGEISREEYNQWRYTYPRIEAERTRKALDKCTNL